MVTTFFLSTVEKIPHTKRLGHTTAFSFHFSNYLFIPRYISAVLLESLQHVHTYFFSYIQCNHTHTHTHVQTFQVENPRLLTAAIVKSLLRLPQGVSYGDLASLDEMISLLMQARALCG